MSKTSYYWWCNCWRILRLNCWKTFSVFNIAVIRIRVFWISESNRSGSDHTGSGRVIPDRVGSGHIGSGRVGSGRVGSGHTGSGRVGSGRVIPDRVGSGRVIPDRVGSGLKWRGKRSRTLESWIKTNLDSTSCTYDFKILLEGKLLNSKSAKNSVNSFSASAEEVTNTSHGTVVYNCQRFIPRRWDELKSSLRRGCYSDCAFRRMKLY